MASRPYTREGQLEGFTSGGIYILEGLPRTPTGTYGHLFPEMQTVTGTGGAIEKSSFRSNDPPMNAVPREELDAKLDTIRAEMDGRFMRVEDKIDALAVTIADLKGTIVEGTKEQRESRRHQTNVAIAIIATVLATGLALYSSITGTNSLMLGAFQTVLSATQQQPEASLAAPKPAVQATRPSPQPQGPPGQ